MMLQNNMLGAVNHTTIDSTAVASCVIPFTETTRATLGLGFALEGRNGPD